MKFILTLLLLLLIGAGVARYIVYTPYGPSTETFVDIAPGSSAKAIAAELEKAGIIRNKYGFEYLSLTQPGSLKAGEYRFDHPASMPDIHARLVHGDVFTRTLTIPEGYNLFDIAKAVETAGFSSRDEFLDAARKNTQLISAWFPAGGKLPDSLEGYLFPATYGFSRHATPLQILTTMTRRFHTEAARLGLKGDITPTVIMASLIEREVRQDSERPLVASVFTNRLAKNMPLATDPTVIYAALLENRFRGTIYASDLQSPSPYNTYKHTGLPPGPICNPGVAALTAAIHPPRTEFLYFVSDANGHSRFSITLKEHDENVRAYREAQQAQTQSR